MSRQESPAAPTGSQYPEPTAAHSLSAPHSLSTPTAYYEGIDGRPLMADEMMDDIQRLDQPAGNSSHPEMSGVEAQPSPPSEQTRPVTPQPSQQPIGPAAQEAQQPYTPDGQSSEGYGDGNKRKRSKVSRACDECRRKKIRCDAAKSDGTIDTCSNCKRINAICQFSRVPLKRGPSKGYIKELSERVQQVEDQMQNQRTLSQTMGPPVGFRNSLDGRQSVDSASAGVFENTFSPTGDSWSKKRTWSAMSEGTTAGGPFTSQYQDRDRMSSGGWSFASAPQHNAQGARYSVAIAPDQLPDIPPPPPVQQPNHPETPKPVKPFWTDLVNHVQGSSVPQVGVQLQESLSEDAAAGYKEYLVRIHPTLPLLPSSQSVLERYWQQSQLDGDQNLASALQDGLELLKSYPKSDRFSTRASIVDILFASTRKHPKNRSCAGNLTFLWLFCLSYLLDENEISRQKQMDRQRLLQMAIDVSLFLVENDDTGAEGDFDSIRSHSRRTLNILSVLARLHALGSGSIDPMPDTDEVWELIGQNDDLATLSDTAIVLARYSNHFASLRLESLTAPNSSADGRHRALINHRLTQQQAREIRSKLPNPMASPARDLVQQIDLFIQLVTNRNLSKINIYSSVEVFTAAWKTSQYLTQKSAEALNPIEPVLPHLYILSAFTFLEFSASPDSNLSPDQDPANLAMSSLVEVFSSLQRLAPDEAKPSQTDTLTWARALKSLILSRHPDIFSRLSQAGRDKSSAESISTRLLGQSSEKTSPAVPTITNGVGTKGSNNAAVGSLNASDPHTNPSASPADHGIRPPKDDSNMPSPNGVGSMHGIEQAAASPSIPSTPPPPKAPGPATRPPPADGGQAAILEKVLVSQKYQPPDFTVLGKHGWVSVLADIVQA